MRKRAILGWGLAALASLLLAVFVVMHIYFSTWLLNYVNNVLADIPGYEGSAQSIDVDLYRGAYRIHKLVVNKKEGKIPTPFIAIETADLSVQWGALFHGRIVSSATLTRPTITFAVDNDAKQTGAEIDWSQPIKKFMPFDFNDVLIHDGSIAYKDFSSTPQVNIYIHHMEGEIKNLRNVEDKDNPMPSTAQVKGSSIGNGNLRIDGRMNILRPVPDMNLQVALENVDLPALNSYSEAYAAFDFKSGTFNLYSQFTVKNDHVSGYVKPMVSHLSVDILKSGNPVQIAWDTAVAAVLKIFTNQAKDQFATRVDLEGDLHDVQTDTWSTLVFIVRNAFVEALKKGFDETGDHDVVKQTP